jgi:two-component system chemotaxis sensor kinase CheA
LLNEMFRAAHSMKGLSAMLQLADIKALTHKIENVLDAARNNELQVHPDVVNALLTGFDSVSAMIDALRGDQHKQIDYQPALDEIARILSRSGAARDVRSQDDVAATLAALEAAVAEAEQVGEAPLAMPELPPADPLADVVDDLDIPGKYLAIFVDECMQALDELSDVLLVPLTTASVEPLLVRCHRVKGAAASIGLHRIARLAHGMEDLLHDLRRTGATPAQGVADVLLKCLDAIRLHIVGIKDGVKIPDALSEACRLVATLCPATAPVRPGSYDEVAEAQPVAALATLPAIPVAAVAEPEPHGDQPVAGSPQPEPVSTPAHAADHEETTPRGNDKVKPAETLRVDIERLDQLMGLAGQLVINKARFGQIGEKLKAVASFKSATQSLAGAQRCAARLANGITEFQLRQSPAEAAALESMVQSMRSELDAAQRELSQMTQLRTLVGELSEAVHQLQRVSDGIQNTVMETRMVPVGPLFTRFKRAVRDLSRGNHKDICLEIHGENTELDKRMIDELSDPLIHLVRNSVDHGIELPETRQAAGKPRQGTVKLDAYHRGNRIIIEVSDDGRGLDADRIRAKAISKGLISEADAEKMSREQIYQMIWQPGFSTAERITEVSGRGMGMDIVLSKIEQLSGSVELTSEPGQGTTFYITLPLTMAIVPSLLTVIDGDVFAIPVESVVEIVQVQDDALSTVHGLATVRVRGRVISLARLSDLFDWEPKPRARSEQESGAGTTLVIVGSEGNELCLVVDDLLGEQDVVIQSMAENFENVSGIAGASILGDGRVSLILDVSALLELACRPRSLSLAHADTPA